MTTQRNTVIATDNVGGITVSTIRRADYGDYETCLFDDRNGKHYGNASRVVGTDGTETSARKTHQHFTSEPTWVLVSLINEGR